MKAGRHAMVSCPLCAGSEAKKLWRSDILEKHIKTIHPLDYGCWLDDKKQTNELRVSHKRIAALKRKQAELSAKTPSAKVTPSGRARVALLAAGKQDEPTSPEECFGMSYPKRVLQSEDLKGDVPSPPKKVLPDVQDGKAQPATLDGLESRTDDGFLVPLPIDRWRHRCSRCDICGSMTRPGRNHTVAACKRAQTKSKDTTRRPSTSSVTCVTSFSDTHVAMSDTEEPGNGRKENPTWDLVARIVVFGNGDDAKRQIYNENEVFIIGEGCGVPLWPVGMHEHDRDYDCSSDEEEVKLSVSHSENLLRDVEGVDINGRIRTKRQVIKSSSLCQGLCSEETADYSYLLKRLCQKDKCVCLSDISLANKSKRAINTFGVLIECYRPRVKYERIGTEKLIESHKMFNTVLHTDRVRYKTAGLILDAAAEKVKINFFSDSISRIPPELEYGKYAIIGLFNANFTAKRDPRESYVSVNDKGGWAILSKDLEVIYASGVCPLNYKELAEPLTSHLSRLDKYAGRDDFRACINSGECLPWSYNAEAEYEVFAQSLASANPEQKVILDTLTSQVNSLNGGYSIPQKPSLWLISGPAGTGKTTVLKGIVAYAKSLGICTLVTAPTKLAASNYKGGKTLHSAFNITLNSNEGTKCKTLSRTAAVIANLRLLAIDEAWSCSKYILMAVDQELRKYHNHSMPMGGVMIVFCGDPYQLLPIPETGQDEKAITLRDVPFWSDIKKLGLKQNMRTLDPALAKFQEQTKISRVVDIPDILRVSEENDLYDFVYPDLSTRYAEPEYFKGRAILCPRRSGVNRCNRDLLQRLPGKEVSLDMKKHKRYELKVKKDCPLMCIRNMPKGLCNGTRLQFIEVVEVSGIKVRVLSGEFKSEEAVLKRTTIGKSYGYPVELAFAMTIHKSQGQTLGTVGVHLGHELFAYGHLYVASTRTRRLNDVRFYSKSQGVTNYVNPEFMKRLEEVRETATTYDDKT